MIILTKSDINNIAKKICDKKDGNLFYRVDNDNEIEIKYFLDFDDDVEDDYLNGTGAHIVKNVEFYVEDVTSYNDEVYFDESDLRSRIENYLI